MRTMLSFILVMVLLSTGVQAEEISVTKSPPKLVRKEFDPKHLPDPKPPLKEHEVALCEYVFGVEVDVRFRRLGVESAAKGGYRASIRVSELSIRLSLSNTIWLPKPCEEWVKPHEEGHRTISLMFYKDAEKTARELAKKVVGRGYDGEAATQEGAYRAALIKASQEYCESYASAIRAPCDRVQSIYDELCPGFRQNGKTVDQTISEALAVWKAEEAEKTKLKKP